MPGLIHEERLEGVHPHLDEFARRMGVRMRLTVVSGVRTIQEQRQYFESGASKTMSSYHLIQPDGWGHAIDLAPDPIDWKHLTSFGYMGGVGDELARSMGLKIVWGGDWDDDGDLKDQSFNDLVHFEYHGVLYQ